MHILDLLAVRDVPAAGVYLSMTRRCPLTCAHCSTSSTMQSEEYEEDVLLRFVETFTPANRPDILGLTGGEPLLRPGLVLKLVERAHAVGTKVALLSGLFFARQSTIPPAIDEAIAAVDHFSVSLDVFHEEQVPREAVFRVLKTLVSRGQDVSVLLVGTDAEDPYLKEVSAQVRREFDDRVPMLVSFVAPMGRSTSLSQLRVRRERPPPEPSLLPCDVLTWPVVGYDGTVVACCNQEVIDGPVPSHLRMGHTASNSWQEVRDRYLNHAMLRAIRTFGPEYVASRYTSEKRSCSGICATCQSLPDDPAIVHELESLFERPTTRWMETQISEMRRPNMTRHTRKEFLHLAKLGAAS